MFIGGKLCSFTLPRGLLDHIVKVKAKETAGVQDKKGRVLKRLHTSPKLSWMSCTGVLLSQWCCCTKLLSWVEDAIPYLMGLEIQNS